MITRALVLAGGISGAAGLSQFPEFSQQYIQRLGGAVDELTRVIAEFDADASAVGLSREAALVDLASSGTMAKARAASMVRTIDRQNRLAADLDALRSAGPFTRASLISHMTDPDIARRALDDFKPAVPLTFEGLFFAGFGFLAGMAGLTVLARILRWPLRKFRRSAAP